jgi:nucleoredoxin
MPTWTELFGKRIVTKKGEMATSEVLKDKKVVGVYFSAHWCPPCRQFTPELSTMYEDMIEMHPDFELIFVSSDQDVEHFKDYYDEMPFKALPFEDRDTKRKLATLYDVCGIPTLVFLNQNGHVTTLEGRELVSSSKEDAHKIWSQLTREETVAPFS